MQRRSHRPGFLWRTAVRVFLAAFSFLFLLPSRSMAQGPSVQLAPLEVDLGFLCCPAGYAEIVSAKAGSGFCSADDLVSMPKGSWSSKTHCCKRLSIPENIPANTTLPVYRLQETVQLAVKVPCTKLTSDKLKRSCIEISGPIQKAACLDCTNSEGVYTALGCIHRVGSKLVTNIATGLIGLTGGVLLVMILVASFKLTTSRGDPKAISEAKEMITSTISGAAIVLLSGTLLQFIGYNVLTIPGFPPPIAQDTGKAIAQAIGLKEELTTIGGTVGSFMNYAIVIGGLLLFLYFVWGGFEMLTGSGDPKAQASGKRRMTAAAAGFAILFVSFWIMEILQILTGAKIFR